LKTLGIKSSQVISHVSAELETNVSETRSVSIIIIIKEYELNVRYLGGLKLVK
jgi:hypothetical protein